MCGPASGYARTWDAVSWPSLTESEGMARGAATWDATKMSTLKMSAEIMARGAATWDAPSRSTLEESAVCIAKQINS